MKSLFRIVGRIVLKGMRSGDWVQVGITLCVILFSLITFSMSTFTAIQFVGQLKWYAWVIAIAVTFSLQLFATLNWLSAFQAVSRKDGLIAVTTGCLLMSFSVGTNYGAVFYGLASSKYAESVFVDQTRPLIEKANAFAERYDQAARDAAALANHSEKMAAREKKSGGTCRDGSGAGPGPRYDRRMDDKALFSPIAEYFGNRATRAKEVAGTLADAIGAFDASNFTAGSEKAHKLFSRLLVISGDPELTRVPEELQSRIRIGREGWKVSGTLYKCPDPELESLAGRLIHALKLPKLPDRPAFFAPTPESAIKLAYERLFSGWQIGSLLPDSREALVIERQRVLREKPEVQVSQGLETSPLLWLLASIFDISIILGSHRLALRQRQRRSDYAQRSKPYIRLHAWRSQANKVNGCSIAIADYVQGKPEPMLDLILEWVRLTPTAGKNQGAFVELFLPNEGDHEQIKSLRKVATLLEAIKAVRLVETHRSVRKLDATWRQRLEVGGTKTVAVYYVDRKFYEDLFIEALVRSNLDGHQSGSKPSGSNGHAESAGRRNGSARGPIVSSPSSSDVSPEPAGSSPMVDAVSALTNLGYSHAQASATIAAAARKEGEGSETAELIRLGLKELAG